MRKFSFELRIVPKSNDSYRLELYEPPPTDTRPAKGRRSTPLSYSQGWYLELSEPMVRRTLAANGYRGSDLKRTRRAPFRLSEEHGVRLDLAFRSVSGLRLRTRIEDILHGIQEMSREEALYWHAKVSGNGGTNGLIALRVLLGGETR